jgi:hypothetical protein
MSNDIYGDIYGNKPDYSSLAESTTGGLGSMLWAPIEAGAHILNAPNKGLWNLLTGGNYDSASEALLPANEPGLDWLDPVRFAVDVLGDPLTYLGIGPWTKGAKIASKAGLTKNFGAKVSEILGKTVGNMEGKLSGKVADLIHGAEQAKAFETAAKASGYASDAIPDMVNQPLGHLLGLHVPFTDIGVGFGSANNPLAMAAARKVDALKNAIRFSGPGKLLADNFGNQALKGAENLGDVHDMGLTAEAMQARDFENHLAAAQYAPKLKDIPYDAQRAFLEDGQGAARYTGKLGPEELKRMGEADSVIRSQLDSVPDWWKNQGLPFKEFQDSTGGKYIPRRQSFAPGANLPLGENMASFDGHQLARENVLRDIPGMTAPLMELARDPQIEAMLANKASVDDIAKYIGQAHGSRIPDAMQHMVNNEGVSELQTIMGRHKELAKTLAEATPETLKAGYFGNAPAADVLQAMTSDSKRRGMAELVQRMLGRDGVIGEAASGARETANATTVGELFNKMGLAAGKDSPYLQGIFGDVIPENWSKHVVDDRVANLLTKQRSFLQAPEEISKIGEYIDPVTGWIKGLQTKLLPKFHGRNRFTGVIQNALHGMFGPQSEMMYQDIARGEVPEGIAKFTNGAFGATDAEAAKGVRDAMYAAKVTTHNPGIVGDALQTAKKDITDNPILGGMLGEHPYDPGFTGIPIKEAALAGYDSAKQAMSQGGLLGKIKGLYGAANKAGDVASFGVESANRASPFLELLHQGYSPLAAAEKVGSAHVNYAGNSFSPLESKVLSRIFPYYKFNKGMAVDVAKNLAERPGGPLAMAIKAEGLSTSNDPLIPDYVKEGGALKLTPGDDGSPRYLAGLGLMHDAAMPWLFGATDPRELSARVMSMLHPVLGGVGQYATGKVFSQYGPHGMRDLEDADPTFGRILSNVHDLVSGPTTGQHDVKPIMDSPLLEAMGGSLLGSIPNQFRIATDTRKGLGAKAASLLMGARVTDVPAKVSEGILAQLAQKRMDELGARHFTSYYVPQDQMSGLPAETASEVKSLELLLSALAKRAKERKQKQIVGM